MRRRSALVAAGMLLAFAASSGVTADAAGTAKVRIVDNYNHGRVRVTVDGTTHKLAYGGRTAFFTITPVSSGNDVITVTSLRYDGCGEGDAGNYFDAGHTYRVGIYHPKGVRCMLPGGGSVPGPGFRVVKLS